MIEYMVSGTEVLSDGRIRIYTRSPDGVMDSTTFRPEAISGRGAEYGLTDTLTILDLILHEPHGPQEWDAPRDDPALAAGWVTGTSPDAEPIHLYNAPSTADARGAHLARIKGNGRMVADPGGHLPALAGSIAVNARHFREHRERVDMKRWELTYGGLPDAPTQEA